MVIESALDYNVENIEQIRKYYKLKEKDIWNKIEEIQEWTRKQDNIPHNLDQDFLEKFLLRNKFRVDKTKKKLTSFYNSRRKYKQYFHADNSDFRATTETVILVPFPKLTPDNLRIILARLEKPKLDEFNPVRSLSFMAILLEILTRCDYSNGESVIIDFSSVSYWHFLKLSPKEMTRAHAIFNEVYSGRPQSIDIINAPYGIKLFLTALRLIVPTKYYERLKVHDSYESLTESIPKNCLPEEYNGTLTESVEDIKKNWDGVLERHVKLLNSNYRNTILSKK